MKKIECLFGFLLLTLCPTLAQEFLVSSSENNIFRVNANLETELVLNVNFSLGLVYDLAAKDTSTVYAITEASTLLKIDLDALSVDLVANLTPGNYTGLYYHPDEELYTIDNNAGTFVRIDPENGAIIEVQPFDQFSPGDLTYFEGSLIFPGADTDIYTYDQNNAPFKIGCIDALVFGFANFFEGCGQNTIWAFDGVSRVYDYDIQTNTFTQIGDLFAQTSNLFGATSFNEVNAALCPPASIASTSCTVSTGAIPTQGVTISPNPSGGMVKLDLPFPQADVHVQVFNDQGQFVAEFEGQQQLDLAHLPAGVYFLSVTNPQQLRWVSKFVLIPER